MTTAPDPERELVRRVAPWSLLAIALGLALGSAAGGWHVGVSAALGRLIVSLTFAAHVLLFVAAFRKPKMIPGKLQLIMESGLQFVREQVLIQMMGPEGLGWLPLLSTLFFFIFLGNVLEVVPGFSFPLNSRLAFPLVMALTSWVVYNGVGIKRHGLFGYLKLVMFPPGAPKVLYVLLTPIEFFSV